MTKLFVLVMALPGALGSIRKKSMRLMKKEEPVRMPNTMAPIRMERLTWL